MLQTLFLNMADHTNKLSQLPISRVKTIMKSSPQVELISNESIYLVAKATELFIKFLAQESLNNSRNSKKLKYKDVAEIVNQYQKLEFLRELIPQKITIADYKHILSEERKKSLKTNNLL